MTAARRGDDRRDELRRALDGLGALELCKRLGLEGGAKQPGGLWGVSCPRHGGGSLSVRVRSGAVLAKCFGGCDFTGDAFALVAEVNRLDVRQDFAAVLDAAARLVGRHDLLAEDRGARLLQTGAATAGRPVGTSPPPTPARSSPRPERRAQDAEQARPANAPNGVDLAELERLWAWCERVTDDAEVSAYLAGRGLDPAAVARLDLARALPRWAPLPKWAKHGRSTWADGWRLMVPMFDALGRFVTVRPRWARTSPPPGDKPLKCPTPAGTSPRGAVMADELGRLLLEHRVRSPVRLVVAEGEPDFLAAAVRWGAPSWTTDGWDEDLEGPRPATATEPPAVWGVVSGSWTDALADRVPDGSDVLVWTDPDRAGDKYAAAVAGLLAYRCNVSRA